jgi:hypothetical protein
MGTAAKAKEKEKAEYPIYTMEEKGKLVLPPRIISQITFLHSHCGVKEWSGLLLYDVVKGDPSKPEDFELEAKHIFLMDIGTAGATDYETDGDIVDLYDQIPEAMEQKLGHIHTHHSGSAYFSGVDTGELQDNVDKFNYYLSLVVNFNGNYAAKVAFLSDMHTTSKMNFINDKGVVEHFKKSKIEKHMVIIDMRIFYGELGGFFSTRLDEVVKKVDAAKKKTVTGFRGYGGHHNSHFSNPNNQLPAHNQHTPHRHIGGKVIPDRMTSWEIEKLTKNILMFDTDLKTESNVYAVLHQIAKTEESQMDLFYDYLLNHIEPVMEAFFDEPLTDGESIIVMKEVIMCISKYEAIAALTEVIENLVEAFETFILGCNDDEEPEIIITNENNDIAKTLEEMEKEIDL